MDTKGTTRRRRSPLPGLLVALAILAAGPAHAGDLACIRAVLFDLGDTLVEMGGGGLFVVRPGAQQAVDGLLASGAEVGIITNVPVGWDRDDLEALLADPSFLDQFDPVVLSSEAPAPKPDPAIYLHAHGLLPTAMPIGNVAFVGETITEIANTPESPTSGARAAGMIGIHLSDAAPDPRADLTIGTGELGDLVTLREMLCAIHVDGFETGDTTGGWS